MIGRRNARKLLRAGEETQVRLRGWRGRRDKKEQGKEPTEIR